MLLDLLAAVLFWFGLGSLLLPCWVFWWFWWCFGLFAFRFAVLFELLLQMFGGCMWFWASVVTVVSVLDVWVCCAIAFCLGGAGIMMCFL